MIYDLISAFCIWGCLGWVAYEIVRKTIPTDTMVMMNEVFFMLMVITFGPIVWLDAALNGNKQ
jgi:EamA domain-containing membrane protein RarD